MTVDTRGYGPADGPAGGFSLVEAVATLGIVAVGLLGLAAVFAQGVGMLSSSRSDFIVKEKASEAVETVYSARDTGVLSWNELRNINGSTGGDGGVFVDGPQPLRDPGPDGLVNTQDDGALQILGSPGPDGVLGTADDEVTVLEGLTREIEIRDEAINLRRIRVVMTYQIGGRVHQYVLTTLISSYA